jgi:hypothetical protein
VDSGLAISAPATEEGSGVAVADFPAPATDDDTMLATVTGEGVGKISLIMNNLDLILRKSILTKNDAITQHK